MDTALVSSEAVDLLSRITGQKLRQQDLTPPVIFLAALITVLLGVMLMDGTITDEEKQRWQQTLNRFIPSQGNVRQYTQLMSKGVRQNQLYKKLNDLLTLTAPFSESERLLLIGFGYEMSAADGDMDAREKKYLEAIANRLGIKPQHLAVLEAGFTHQGTVEPTALGEVQSLLDPARFHELDTMFVRAASDMLAALPSKPEDQGTPQHQALSYGQLKEFQTYRKQLDNLCYQVFEIIQDCNTRDFLPQTLAEEIGKVSRKLQSQRFRVAVVGEFSQGKSTLLNALLGEEIQPVRAIPCSGTVTVLKYGANKRVICRYKDKLQEEISFEQYQLKAAISEEAALGSLSDELVQSEIEEIIFEHPDLDLCSSGVEILDSPGLNEHPDRTAITQQLLKGTDAVIFLTNASRPLTQGERDLMQDLKVQLNGGRTDEPAENLFVAVNFMDLLRREKDRQDVRQRLERLVQGQNIITGENRVHFISAQAALDAILAGTEDEYLKAFQSFTQSIETYLVVERGSLGIKQAVTKVNALIQEGLEGLHQAEDVLHGKLELSETEKQNILEQIGEASGRDVKIQNLAKQLKKQASQEAIESWEQWKNGLPERMAKKSEKWFSNHSPVFSQKKLIEDYINKFIEDVKAAINTWADKQLRDFILKENLKVLDDTIYLELEAIKAELKSLDHQVKTHISEQLDLGINGINDDFMGDRAFLGGIGVGGAVAAALIFLTPLGWVAVIMGSLAAAIVGELGSGIVGFDGIRDQIKRKVCEIGVQKLKESPVDDKLKEIISSVFNDRVASASQVIAQAISLCENILEQQEKAHKKTLQQREADKAWIVQKRQELEQVQRNIEAIIPS
jgi:uncharacterized tellurite resistance protein B-like protein/GTPase SAR1 family protein